ncbi:MAG: T9SS type A sorting domain-containing protein [Fluviicola sp.]|nr:T9SS type A sorting domain-containing protein [Fluviicola sp.]
MKKLILSSLLLAAITQLNAQLDSSAFSVTALTPFNSAQFISTPINSSLQFTQDYTLECWVYVPTPAFSGTEIHLIECYGFSNVGGFVLRLSQTNKVKGYAMGATNFSVTGSTSIQFNTWNHVATTYNSTTGELKVFLNGIQDGTDSPNIAIYNNAATLKIGARGDDSNINNSIFIDEVRIWNTAKTASELAANMNTCLAGNEAGLALYYDFENEPVSGTITDKTANNNDGTYISNGETFSLGVFDCPASNLGLTANELATIEIFPNPTTDVITVSSSEPIESMSLFSLAGELMTTTTHSNMSLVNLASGVYVLVVKTENGETIQRVVKE